MMKQNQFIRERGTVLITALLTITIMTLICATSLLVTSQNTNSGMQVASWQQALSAAESGIDAAIRALNDDGQTGAWTNWVSVSQTVSSGTYVLPTVEPTAQTSPAATAKPNVSPSAKYNYLPSTALQITFPGGTEGPSTGSAWVVMDTAGMQTSQDTNHKQWYRIRSTGLANLNGVNGQPLVITQRIGNNRLDNDLRNTLALKFNRKTASSAQLGPTRTLEVIMQPLAAGGWARGITLKTWISMSGSGVIDSYDSGSSSKSTNHLYDSSKRQSHGDVGTLNTAGKSDLRSTYVYGNLSYSGATVKNTTNVKGTISSPFSVAIPQPTPPTWTPTTTYTGGGSNPPNGGTFNAGTAAAPAYIKVNGDLVISSSGNPLHIVQNNSSNTNNYIYVWVTGKLTTQGSGYIAQDAPVNVVWYVGGDITISGTSYQNASGYASMNSIVGYGTNNKLTVSGSADFVGTFNTPGYAATVSGGGSVNGALIANTLTISGGSGFHYDEALGGTGGSLTIGNFAYASWFEDNSDPNRKDGNGNYIIY
jgi:hypothetical protein